MNTRTGQQAVAPGLNFSGDAMKDAEKEVAVVAHTRWAYGAGIVVSLAVLAVTILLGMLFVRGLVREQIARRDAEALHATVLMEQLYFDELNDGDVLPDEQLGFDAAVRASRLRGVMGIRFYTKDGIFTDSFPATIQPRPLNSEAAQSVAALKPYSRFYRAMPLSEVFIYLPQFAAGQIDFVPVLEVTVPLYRPGSDSLSGSAQFIIEGTSIQDEYKKLDHRLIQIAGITFFVAGILLAALLWPAFRCVEKLNVDLALRGERLRRANEELALAARISAVGSISAHLMHGLKSPLASLMQFVSRSGERPDELDKMDWQDALAASRRMQSLVEQTMEVLSDTRGEPAYEISVRELTDDLRNRVEAAAAASQVRLSIRTDSDCKLSSHKSNLISLILVNLLENAIEATSPGRTVELSVALEDERLCFRVRDEGPGFPEHLRDHIFLPCKSTREGGSGLGLAISKQIAEYLDAKLELAQSLPQGCLWVLDLALSACQEAQD